MSDCSQSIALRGSGISWRSEKQKKAIGDVSNLSVASGLGCRKLQGCTLIHGACSALSFSQSVVWKAIITETRDTMSGKSMRRVSRESPGGFLQFYDFTYTRC